MVNDVLNKDTIIAPISGLSGGSVHVLRISGENAISLTQRFFSNKAIAKIEKNRFFYGQLVNEKNKPIDDVIVLVYRKPNSYTGEDVVEISCHANILITQEIIDLYLRNGCRLAQPGEFTKRAFLNGKMDLIQAESVADIISAKSKKALSNALSQLEGVFSVEIKEIKDQLIQALSLLELNIDFSEEDLEVITDEQILEKISATIDVLEKYTKSFKQARSLLNGVKVLIAGKPNVGKSSLMNALLEQDRVLVSEIPGTTRDFVHDEIYIDDVLVKFIDSAGIRDTEDILEKEGVKRAERLFEEVDQIILMFDFSSPFDKDDQVLIKKIAPFRDKVIFVANKIDLGYHSENEAIIKKSPIKVSAKNKENIEKIKNEIKKRLQLGEGEETFINNERQYHLIKQAINDLKKATESLKQKIGHEFVSMELREAVTALSELTGEITNEEILNNIFSHFCIGK